MSPEDTEKEKIRLDKLRGLTKQVEVLEMRARLLEAKVRIAEAQDKLGVTPGLKNSQRK
jgi:hypothetical protein